MFDKNDEKKDDRKAERCKAILEKLEKMRDVLEDEYINALEISQGNVSSSTIDLLDHIQELDEHIAEMKKQTK